MNWEKLLFRTLYLLSAKKCELFKRRYKTAQFQNNKIILITIQKFLLTATIIKSISEKMPKVSLALYSITAITFILVIMFNQKVYMLPYMATV